MQYTGSLLKRLPGVVAVLVTLIAAAVAMSAMAGAAEAEALRHLRLVSSSPAADDVVAGTPAEVRLVFSEAPRMPGTSLRLTRGTDSLVPTTDTEADSEDPKQIVVRPVEPLAAGSYTVHWRVIARDGHAQNGTFGFRVAAAD